jgi:hypothetical protein
MPVTVAGDDVRFDPFAGDPMLTAGAVRSIFNVTLAVLVFPAVSTTVPLMT